MRPRRRPRRKPRRPDQANEHPVDPCPGGGERSGGALRRRRLFQRQEHRPAGEAHAPDRQLARAACLDRLRRRQEGRGPAPRARPLGRRQSCLRRRPPRRYRGHRCRLGPYPVARAHPRTNRVFAGVLGGLAERFGRCDSLESAPERGGAGAGGHRRAPDRRTHGRRQVACAQSLGRARAVVSGAAGAAPVAARHRTPGNRGRSGAVRLRQRQGAGGQHQRRLGAVGGDHYPAARPHRTRAARRHRLLRPCVRRGRVHGRLPGTRGHAGARDRPDLVVARGLELPRAYPR